MVESGLDIACRRHDEKTLFLEKKIRELNNQLAEHKKAHPLCDKAFWEGVVGAVVDRMVERELLSEPKIEPVTRGWADYSVEIVGDVQGNREARYMMHLTADKVRITLVSATGSGLGFRHFKLPEINLDAIIDGLDCHISAKAREPLDKQVKKAKEQKAGTDNDASQWPKKDREMSL